MKMLHPIPQCSECLISLARTASTMAAGDNPEFIEEMEAGARHLLDQGKDREWTSPQIANKILRRIRDASRIFDPYLNFKIREMDKARSIYERIEARLPRGLYGRVKTAIVGNSFDFFKNPDTLYDEISNILSSPDLLAFDHTHELEAFLKTGKQNILYFTDNAGEIYFDMPLYDYLADNANPPVLIVKGGPALNDLTRDDLRRVGLADRFCRVEDTGTDGVGIDWDRVSDRFRKRVREADLIISKGMANFETIFPRALSCPVLYLFRVKCEPIQNFISAPVGNNIALWKEAAVT